MAHDGVPLVVAIGALSCLAAGYGWASVPSLHGGPLPVWLLTPPTLALFAGIGASNAVPPLIWCSGAELARLAWSIAVCGLAGSGAGLVGASVGQAGLARSAVLLSGLVFGGSVLLGRFAPLLAAAPIVVLLAQVHAARDLTPGRLWDALSSRDEVLVWVSWTAAIAAYAYLGDRPGRPFVRRR